MNGNSWKFLFVILALTMAGSTMVDAAIITVNDLNDNETYGDTLCTLREAINNANSDSDITSGDCTAGNAEDRIVFSDSGTITLGSELPSPSGADGLTIDGTGQDVVISGNNDFRILDNRTALVLRALTVSNGNGFTGGAMLNIAPGTLMITNCTFSGNTAGGGIGGAIWNTGENITISNSTFSDNSTGGNPGGAIYLDAGTVNVINSTFSDNSAGFHFGGAIYVNTAGTLTVTNSTFSGNSAGSGGAIYNLSVPGMVITNSTFSDNSASDLGGGIFNSGLNVNILNTIIANSSSGGDCVDGFPLATNINNLIEDGSCSPALFGDPKLQALDNNGGPTQTMALASDSPAIDAGDDATCATAPVNNVDQRGFVRPIDGNGDSVATCDIGAYELGSFPPLQTIEATIDIQFCDNPNGFNCKKKGVLPVMIFGTDDIDVSAIDIATVELCLASDPNECVSPMDAEFPQDRGNPETDLGINSCLSANPDGFDDLGVLFVAREVAQLIECSTIGKGNASPTLIIKGELNDGTQFQSTPVNDIGIDQLLIVSK